MKIYLFLIMLLVSGCASFYGSQNEDSIIAICVDDGVFTKKCKYFEKTSQENAIDLVSLSQSDKPKRGQNAFIKFDFFSKISFYEAKNQATKMCAEAFRDLEYLEVVYTSFMGIDKSGMANIWCTIGETKVTKKDIQNFENYQLTTE